MSPALDRLLSPTVGQPARFVRGEVDAGPQFLPSAISLGQRPPESILQRGFAARCQDTRWRHVRKDGRLFLHFEPDRTHHLFGLAKLLRQDPRPIGHGKSLKRPLSLKMTFSLDLRR